MIVLIALYPVEKNTVPNNSMQPLLYQGDEIWGLKSGKYTKGNIVVIRIPTVREDYEVLVGRVYGVPKDKIRVYSNKIEVNGTVVKILNDEMKSEEFILNKDEYLIIPDATDSVWMKVDKRLINSRMEGKL